LPVLNTLDIADAYYGIAGTVVGHFNIKTTERYLHVTRETLINIESPLDALYRKA
jgi:hypothetical protein